MFDKQTMQEIVDDYNSGMTLRQLGDKYFCSYNAVRKYIIRHGGATRPKYRPRIDREKLLEDWNNDMTMREMSYRHKTTSNYLYFIIPKLRQDGYPFKKRLIHNQSEMITAGCIRQSRG